MTIAKTFNSYFKSATDSLELFNGPLQSNVSCDKVQNIIKSFSNHPSIIKIEHKFKLNKKFSFQCASEAIVRKVEKSLLSDKATAGEIRVNVLKNSENLTNCINEAIRNNNFPDSLKLSDITPVFKNLTLVIKPIIHESVFYHYYQRYFKKLLMTSFMNI